MLNPYLIVSIVRKGWGDTVLEASMKAGAHGGTVLFGRGIGRNEQQRVFGIQIEPEKEIVLTVVGRDQKEAILQEIVRAAQLNAPGHGLAFTMPIEQVAGIVHLVEEPPT
jgi:nitrogen regulatory protein PII